MITTIPLWFIQLLQLVLVGGILAFICLIIFVKLTSKPYPKIECLPGEATFKATEDGLPSSQKPDQWGEEKFPSLDDKASIDLSVIVPAYNEEERLPTMLDECLDYLETRQNLKYEVIIVNDGSKDKTTDVGLDYARKFGSNKVRVLALHKNRGKGGAVRMGMLRARGKKLLFADADGATKFADVSKLEDSLKSIESPDGFAIVCGSRAHLEKESIAQRTFFRTVLMYGFHLCVWIFAVKNVRDTQCGFKLLTRPTARIVFRSLHIERWAFDVEMLKIAEMLSIPVAEVSVRWTEIEGSKLDPISAAIQMFRDIFLLWLRYAVGAWRLSEKMD